MTRSRRRILSSRTIRRRRQTRRFPRTSGYQADLALNGNEGLRRARPAVYAVMTIDRMLPGIDGFRHPATARGRIVTPALIISALGEVDDRVRGLRAGGDDYLVKPFAFAELLARIEALARRSTTVVEGDGAARRRSRAGSRVANGQSRRPGNRAVAAGIPGARISGAQRGQVVPRAMLLQHVWDLQFRSDDQHHRCLCRPRSPQGRQPAQLSADPHDSRRRILCPCSLLRPYDRRPSSWR